jgi:hypothetical protein
MRRTVRALCLATGLLRMSAADALERRGAQPGEAFTFKFSVGPVESGRARMAVAETTGRGGRRVLSIHGQAETAKWLQLLVRLDDDYQLVLDAQTLLPVRVITTERGIRERRIETRLSGRLADLSVSGKQAPGRAHRLLPSPVRDPLSQLFWLRAAPLLNGEHVEQDILDGDALWRARLDIHRGERVHLDSDGEQGAARTAIRIDGELERIADNGNPIGQPKRHLSAWLSDDLARVLLRLEADTDLGRCSLELTSYLPPR